MTGQESAIRRKFKTLLSIGAEPVITYLILPPNFYCTLENTIAS